VTFAEIIPGLLEGKKYSWEPGYWYIAISDPLSHIKEHRPGGESLIMRVHYDDLTATDWEEVECRND